MSHKAGRMFIEIPIVDGKIDLGNHMTIDYQLYESIMKAQGYEIHYGGDINDKAKMFLSRDVTYTDEMIEYFDAKMKLSQVDYDRMIKGDFSHDS